jgi:hypothetical protein
MRLSGLLVVSILLCSTMVFAQHGGGGGGSHGSSSGGSSFARSAGFSSSRGTITASTHSSGTVKVSSAKTSAKSERKVFANKIEKPSFGCARGQNCTCPGGARNGFGGCTAPKIASCTSGVWNGYSCGAEGWFNDCRQLADQMALQQRQLYRNGIRDGLRFRLLEDQYDYCQHAFRGTLPWLGLEEE